MKALLLAITLTLIGSDALASGAVWRQRTVVVSDFTTAEWRPHVAEAVRLYNLLLPKKAPRLVYRARAEVSCNELNRRRGIAVCAMVSDSATSYMASMPREHRFKSAEIGLPREVSDEEGSYDHGIVCHEMFHALTYAKHGAWVWVDPCPYGAAVARHMYRRFDRKNVHRHR